MQPSSHRSVTSSSPATSPLPDKDMARLQDAFGRLHEFFTRIIMASYRYDLVSRSGNHYLAGLKNFQNTSKAKKNLPYNDHQISLAMTALQKLVVDLKNAVIQLEPFQRRIHANPVYQATAKAVNASKGRALMRSPTDLRDYLLLAESIISHPIFAQSLLHAMVFVQLDQNPHSDIYVRLLPILRYLKTDDEKSSSAVIAANTIMTKQHYYHKIAPPSSTIPQADLPVPAGEPIDPVEFIEQPLGFSARFYPISKDCLGAAVAALSKIETKDVPEIKAYHQRLLTLQALMSTIASESNRLAPPDDPDACLRLTVRQQGEHQSQAAQIKEMELKIAQLQDRLQSQAPTSNVSAATPIPEKQPDEKQLTVSTTTDSTASEVLAVTLSASPLHPEMPILSVNAAPPLLPPSEPSSQDSKTDKAGQEQPAALTLTETPTEAPTTIKPGPQPPSPKAAVPPPDEADGWDVLADIDFTDDLQELEKEEQRKAEKLESKAQQQAAEQFEQARQERLSKLIETGDSVVSLDQDKEITVTITDYFALTSNLGSGGSHLLRQPTPPPEHPTASVTTTDPGLQSTAGPTIPS